MLDIGNLYGNCKMIGWIFGLFVGTVSASTLPTAFLYQLGSITYKKLYNTCPTDEISNRIVILSAFVNGCVMMLMPWRAVQMIALLHNHGLVIVTNFLMAKLIERKKNTWLPVFWHCYRIYFWLSQLLHVSHMYLLDSRRYILCWFYSRHTVLFLHMRLL